MGTTDESLDPPTREVRRESSDRIPAVPSDETVTRAKPGKGTASYSTIGRGQSETRSIIEACQAELATGPDAARGARLHYNIARELELSVGRLDQAIEHYKKALELQPELLPAIRAARRCLLADGQPRSALPLYGAEIELTRDPRARAVLHYANGRLLEDSIGDFDAARKAYQAALALNPDDAGVLKALERIEARERDLSALAEVLRKSANLITEDNRLHATLLTQRARVIEQLGQPKVAAELYGRALRLDDDHPTSAPALERILHDSRDWKRMVELFERFAQKTNDRALASLFLRRAARLKAEHLDNEAEATAALATAMELQPKEPLVLDELAPLYQQGERIISLAEVLRQQILISADAGERTALLHSLGHIYELLAHDQQAIVCFANALELNPTHSISIKALDRLYTRYEDWQGLIRVYVGEAGYTEDSERGAAAHVRAATIYEERLGNPQAAIDHYARALARVPLHPIAFKALVRLYRQAKRFRELVELLDQGAELAEPDQSIALLFQVAQVWEDALDDPGRAAATYQRILALEPANLAAVHGLQRASERSGRYLELVQALELELELGTEQSRGLALHHRIGVILADHLDDPDAAISHFRNILDVDPTHPPTLAELGKLYRTSGRWNQLLDIYQRELIRARDERSAAVLLHKMGELCERCLGSDDQAIDHYRRALDHDTTYRPALRAVAQQLRKRRDWQALIEVLKLEAQQAQDAHLRTIGWYRVGEVYEYHLDDSEQAANAYELAIASVPGHRPSLAALARLRQERGDWQTLLQELVTEIELTTDTARKVTLALLRGAIYRDHLEDYPKAIACFQAVLGDQTGKMPALVALEELYPLVGDYDRLAATHRAIADATTDRHAKLSALRELARVMETHGAGSREQLLATYRETLAMVPGDLFTLERLEELARSSNDPALAETVYLQLADVSDDPTTRAHYLTLLAGAMEAQQNFRAIDVYRRAIDENKEQLAAVRGLARLAESLGDTAALADALRIEAQQTSDPQIAAKLYVRSASLRIATDGEGGIGDLRRALELHPELEAAANQLISALTKGNRLEELISDLTSAARECRASARAAELWLQVATLQSDLNRHAAGIISLQRGLTARPDHVPSLLKVAELHRHESQWRSAVNALERVLDASKERDLYCNTQLELAELWDAHLDSFEKAKTCVAAVLQRHPLHHGAMWRQADYHLREGNRDHAAELMQRLIGDTRDANERADALVKLAEIEGERGNDRASEEALREALTLQGPTGKAAEAYRARAKAQGSWVGFAAGLAAHLQQVTSGPQPRPNAQALAAAYQELAQIYSSGMALPKKAIETLREALRHTNGNTAIHLELAERLRNAGQIVEAIHEIRRLLDSDAANAHAWNLFAELLSAAGHRDEADYARHPLQVLDVERGQSRVRAKILAAPISIEVVHALAPERSTSSPAGVLLASAADAAGKLFPPSLERYGLSRRDRIGARSGLAIRDAADRIAEIFTVDEFDFYVHAAQTPLISIELTDVPAIVLSRSAARLSGSQQAFLLSYAMAALAARFYPALRLSARELELLLAASARASVEGYSSPVADDARLHEHAQLVKKSVSRRWRRAFDLAGADYARTRINVAHWQQSLLHTAIRSALIVCDDLKSGIKVLRKMHSMPELHGRELVESSRTVADLMRFWVSDDAFHARRRVGLITPPPPPPAPPGS